MASWHSPIYFSMSVIQLTHFSTLLLVTVVRTTQVFTYSRQRHTFLTRFLQMTNLFVIDVNAVKENIFLWYLTVSDTVHVINSMTG